MKIDVIFTFDGAKPQQRANYPFVVEILKSKRVLINFLCAELSREERSSLIKISTCIQSHLQYPVSKDKTHWFNKCRGKIWVDDLERWRKQRGFNSTVSPKFIEEFMTTNYSD